jgi:hypothetical protein
METPDHSNKSTISPHPIRINFLLIFFVPPGVRLVDLLNVSGTKKPETMVAGE